MTVVRVLHRILVLVVMPILGCLIIATIFNYFADKYGADLPERYGRAYAVATSCERHGPVSTHGFGYWWTCQADVHWQGNSEMPEPRTARFLTPEDIGKPVRVSGTHRNRNIVRGAEQPYFAVGILLCFPFGVLWIFMMAWTFGLVSPARKERRLTRGMELVNERERGDSGT